MELTFNKERKQYVAEFPVIGNFNLHIEQEVDSVISVYQRGSETGEYMLCKTFNASNGIFDYDFGAVVYPKYIKVISGSPVLKCILTYNE